MSYREIAPHIGKPHTTIRTWMLKYFPKLAAKMGGVEHGNAEATQPPVGDLQEQHTEEALEAVRGVSQRLSLLTPEARWQVMRQLEDVLKMAQNLGVKEPPEKDF